MGVAVDTNFNVYIADTGDNTIREVTTDGNIATIAGDSFPSYQGDAGLAITAELHSPEDVAVDSSGNIYIADTANAYIRKVTTDGNINYIAGDGSIGFAGDGGYATSAGLIAPFALAVDSSGNVYFAENGDSRIRKIDAKSLDISTVAGNGTPGFTGDGRTATKAQMNSPTGVAVDSAGNLYIADSLNCRIRKVASGGNISTFAGNGTFSYSGDGGAAVQAQLNTPQGVAADAAGNFYIADTLNNVVRKVSPNGTISNFAGNGGAGNSGDGSAATSAQLNGPQGLAVDASGNLFIADTLNAKVRKVSRQRRHHHRGRKRHSRLWRRWRRGRQRATEFAHRRGGGLRRQPVHRGLRQQPGAQGLGQRRHHHRGRKRSHRILRRRRPGRQRAIEWPPGSGGGCRRQPVHRRHARTI